MAQALHENEPPPDRPAGEGRGRGAASAVWAGRASLGEEVFISGLEPPPAGTAAAVEGRIG
jgi:hypothetical protein